MLVSNRYLSVDLYETLRRQKKSDSDPFGCVVPSCSLGKHAAIVTGSSFQIIWNNKSGNLVFCPPELIIFIGKAWAHILWGPRFLDVPRKLCCCLIWLNQMECYFCVLIYLLHLKINKEYGYGIYDFSLLVRTDQQKARYTRLDDVGSIVEEMLVEDHLLSWNVPLLRQPLSSKSKTLSSS